MKWLLSHDGPATGADNMALDGSLAVAARNAGAILMRTYTWDPWAISLGKNQPEHDVNTMALAQAGFHLVRRPTGGRAVFHANELTYCAAVATQLVGRGEFYEMIHHLLLDALSGFLEGLGFQPSQPDLRHHYRTQGAMGAVCFSASARTELVWRGRKIVGSAQHVSDGVILQHGSILCGPEHLGIADFLNGGESSELRNSIEQHSISLSEACGRPISPNQVEVVIRSAVEST